MYDDQRHTDHIVYNNTDICAAMDALAANDQPGHGRLPK